MSNSDKKLDPDLRTLYIVIFIFVAGALILSFTLGDGEAMPTSVLTLIGIAGLIRYMFWKNWRRWW